MTKEQDLRENEVAVDLPTATDAALRFIGVIRTPFTSRDLCPRQGRQDGPDCQLVLDQPWVKALKGLEKYREAEVLYWLHKSRRDLILQSPRSNGETTGTFALRSPVRPNPIGLSRVQIVAIDGAVVTVRGLDCLDGTPLIDIKPERCAYSPEAAPKAADT